MRAFMRQRRAGSQGIRWWIRFTVGPLPVQLAVLAAFAALALAAYSVGVTQRQVSGNRARASRLAVVVSEQGADRLAAINANTRARRDDCDKVNRLREGLRTIVTQSEAQVPVIRRSLHLPDSYFAAARNLYSFELRLFKDDDCHAYAIEALPPRERRGR